MDADTSKILGGVGAILLVISPLGVFASGFSGLLGLVGVILVVIALKGFADYYREGGIFRDAMYGLVIVIVGAVIFGVAFAVTAVSALNSLGISMSNVTNYSQIRQVFTDPANQSKVLTFAGTAFAEWVVFVVFLIVAAIFVRRSLTVFSDRSGVHMFKTVGLLTLIGAALTFIIIGLILLWITVILLIVAFFSISPQPSQSSPTIAPPPTPPPTPPACASS